MLDWDAVLKIMALMGGLSALCLAIFFFAILLYKWANKP